MKHIYLLLLFLVFCGLCSAQTRDRVEIEGRVIVPGGFDAEGITIYNKTAGHGTVSSEKGEFTLLMAVGDSLFFSGIQFKELRLKTDEQMIESGRLHVEIFEGINELPEIVVRPHSLTGILEKDLERIEVVELEFPKITLGPMDFRPDAQTSPQNAAMGNNGGGANLLGLLGAVVNLIIPKRSPKAEKKKYRPDSPGERMRFQKQVRELYDDAFFEQNFSIPAHKISDFIAFCGEKGFGTELFQAEKELDLIQFLLEQSNDYRKLQASN